MKPDERETLREKHSQNEKNQCSYCLYENYPCDVIKVLDVLGAIAMETTKYLQDVKIVPENIIDNIIKILDGVNES
jgi:hypothetical protein